MAKREDASWDAEHDLLVDTLNAIYELMVVARERGPVTAEDIRETFGANVRQALELGVELEFM